MFKYNHSSCKCLTCCLLYHGDVVPKDVTDAFAIIKAKHTMQFVDWGPTVFNYQLSLRPEVQRALCIMSNTIAIIES